MKVLDIKIHFEMHKTFKNEKAALKIIRGWADEVFPSGYTIYLTKGIWKGKSSDSFTIERYDTRLNLLRDKSFLKKVKILANKLKQEEIIVNAFKTDLETIKIKKDNILT